MKTHIITLLWCCFSIIGFGQSIADVEYFFNTDPGFGNATPITVNANTGSVTQTVSLPVNSLTGFNSFYVRAKDNSGTWSLYDKRIFYVTEFTSVTTASNITSAEYFINTDPGFGNATPISVNANTGNLTQVLSLPIGNMQGFNTLYIRTKDDLGVWSMYDRRLFYIRNDTGIVIPNITAAEYFYNEDPGFGNGTPATMTPTANPNEFTLELAIPDITCNLHDFYIRLKNSDGKWSLYDYRKDIEVFDNENPTIVVFPNITAELNTSGQATITIANVNNGTYDDCQLASVVLNQPQYNYTCANLGANTVKVIATDAESKVSNLDVTITVLDKINPVAVTKNITVQLDANGHVSVLPAQIENGSTDNCSITGYSLDVSSFNCTNIGINTVHFTVSDASGNTNTASATVTVQDATAPTVIGKNITVNLDENISVTILPSNVDNGTFDNCGIVSLSIDTNTFTSGGIYPVILTAMDNAGNTNSVSVNVTVETITFGIEDNEQIGKQIFLYPVPSQDNVNISTNLIINTLEIFDISGRILNKIDNPKSKIEISKLPSGIYFLKFYVEDKSAIKRIIKK